MAFCRIGKRRAKIPGKDPVKGKCPEKAHLQGQRADLWLPGAECEKGN